MLHPVVLSCLAIGLMLFAGCNPAHIFTDDAISDDPVAALIADLEAAGVEAARGGSAVAQPFLSGEGHGLRVEQEVVQAFVYPDAEAAAREAEAISPDGSAFAGSGTATMVTWIVPPHFFRRERVIVLYLGEEATILSALEAVLGEQFAGR